MGRRARGTAEIAADYTRTPLGTWRVTITSPAGTNTVDGHGELPDLVEETVMPMVQRHTDQIGGPCMTVHTLNGDAAAFMAAYKAAGGAI
jgi:hypothetical protein